LPDETIAFLRRALEGWRTGAEYTWALTLREELIGMIGARVSGALVNLGYVLARPYWNRGYMTEAVKAVVGWALDEEEVFRVWAVCDVENRASARVLEKAGLEREGILRRWIVLPNLGQEPRDCTCFAKVK
jgi:ribosomal-protein-alanine N-acetyltransferase